MIWTRKIRNRPAVQLSKRSTPGNAPGRYCVRKTACLTTPSLTALIYAIFGTALTLTSGVPVYGIPDAFGAVFSFGRILDIPSPVYVTAGIFVAMYVLLNRTRMGRYFYAVGGSIKASRLSGINTRFYLFMAYVLCGALAAIAGALLTARLGTGEANIGASMPLDSIAACIIGGVSLRGGIGSVGNVVLGAVFIGLIQNGMDLAQIQSYLQEVVIGVLLILAAVADQLRQFVLLRLKD